MDFVRNLVEQSRQLWLKSGSVQRAGFIAVSVAAILAIGTVGWWSSRPQYIPLATGLAPSEAADIVSNLEAAGIAHDMNFSGSTVLVPKQRFNDARGAAGDSLVESTSAGGGFSGSILSDPVMNRHRVLRATGAIGGYRWGPTRKRLMVGRELARAGSASATSATS